MLISSMFNADDEFLSAEHDFIPIAQPEVDIRFKLLPVQESSVQALQVADIILSVPPAEDQAMPSSDIQISTDPAIDVNSPSQKKLRILYREIISPVR